MGDEEIDQLVGGLARLLLNSVDNGGVGRLWPTLGVEDQRMLPPTPGAAVVQTPKRDALDQALVLREDGEEFGVVFRLLVQIFGRGGSRGLGTTAPETAAELAARCPANRDVELRDADLQPE